MIRDERPGVRGRHPVGANLAFALNGWVIKERVRRRFAPTVGYEKAMDVIRDRGESIQFQMGKSNG